MKKSLTAYLKALSKNKVDTIDEIVSTKYRKFKKLYWLLKNYSDDIFKMEYHKTDDTATLAVNFEIRGESLKTITDELTSLSKETDELQVEIFDNTIFIVIKTEDGAY